MDPSRQIHPRAPERCMYPDELIRLMWLHRASHINTLGVESNRWGQRTRKEVGLSLENRGSVWFATLYTKEMCNVVGTCLPYDSRGKEHLHFNPHTNRMEGTDKVEMGWRSLFADWLKSGFLAPSEELGYLIGESIWTTRM